MQSQPWYESDVVTPARSAVRTLSALSLGVALFGCSLDGGTAMATPPDDVLDAGEFTDASAPMPDGQPPMPPITPSIAIGVRDDDAQIAYIPLESQGDLQLHTYGQGGLHAAFVIECTGFGNQAWVDIAMRSLREYDGVDGGAEDEDADAGIDPGRNPGEVSTTPNRRPSLLICDDLLEPVVCRSQLRILMTGALADSLEELDNLHVEIRADVRNEDGLMLSTVIEAYLRR